MKGGVKGLVGWWDCGCSGCWCWVEVVALVLVVHLEVGWESRWGIVVLWDLGRSYSR